MYSLSTPFFIKWNGQGDPGTLTFPAESFKGTAQKPGTFLHSQDPILINRWPFQLNKGFKDLGYNIQVTFSNDSRHIIGVNYLILLSNFLSDRFR